MRDDEALLKTRWNMLHNPIQTRHLVPLQQKVATEFISKRLNNHLYPWQQRKQHSKS